MNSPQAPARVPNQTVTADRTPPVRTAPDGDEVLRRRLESLSGLLVQAGTAELALTVLSDLLSTVGASRVSHPRRAVVREAAETEHAEFWRGVYYAGLAALICDRGDQALTAITGAVTGPDAT